MRMKKHLKMAMTSAEVGSFTSLRAKQLTANALSQVTGGGDRDLVTAPKPFDSSW